MADHLGASVIHLHVRRDDGSPTQDRALFQKAIDAIRARCDVIVQTSTGGAVGMSADERAQPLECVPPPDMATLNAGSLNFGEDVFLNPFPLVREFAKRMRARKIAYELECYDVGHVEACLRLAQEGVISLPAPFDFVMGVRGGIRNVGSRRDVLAGFELHPAARLPDRNQLGVHLDEIPGVQRREEFDRIVGAEEALVAVVADEQLRGHVAEEREHARAIHQVAAIVGVMAAHAQPDHRLEAHWGSPW